MKIDLKLILHHFLGGMARTAHVVRAYRERAAQGTGPPVIFLNAGDSFVGTTWFSVFTWNITSAFINLLEPDAIVSNPFQKKKNSKR